MRVEALNVLAKIVANQTHHLVDFLPLISNRVLSSFPKSDAKTETRLVIGACNTAVEALLTYFEPAQTIPVRPNFVVDGDTVDWCAVLSVGRFTRWFMFVMRLYSPVC